MQQIFIKILILVSFVSNSYGQNYKLGTDSEGVEEYIKTDLIDKTKNGITYFIERKHPNDIKKTLFKKLMDCDNQKWMILEMHEWDSNKKKWNLVAELANKDTVLIPNSSLVQGSAAWYQMKLVCSHHNSWTFENNGMNGDKYFIDYNKIKKKDNLVLFWRLRDYSKPTPLNDVSLKTLTLSNCNEKVYMNLEFYYYKNNKGKKIISKMILNPIKKQWAYPDKTMENILEKICR